jgi:hypothetical protein
MRDFRFTSTLNHALKANWRLGSKQRTKVTKVTSAFCHLQISSVVRITSPSTRKQRDKGHPHLRRINEPDGPPFGIASDIARSHFNEANEFPPPDTNLANGGSLSGAA